jgi:hypothetical protein
MMDLSLISECFLGEILPELVGPRKQGAKIQWLGVTGMQRNLACEIIPKIEYGLRFLYTDTYTPTRMTGLTIDRF